MLKYKILENDYRIYGSKKLFRIVALRDIIYKNGAIETVVAHAGEIGGYLESENNLSQEGSCWVSDFSIVEGKSVVKNDAIVKECSSVKGCSIIKDNATIISSEITCNALISGNAIIKKSFISDQAHIRDSFVKNCNIIGNTKVVGNIELEGCIVKEFAKIKTICSQPQNILPRLKAYTFKEDDSVYTFCVPDVELPTTDRTIIIVLDSKEENIKFIAIGSGLKYFYSFPDEKKIWDGLRLPLLEFLLIIKRDLKDENSVIFLDTVTSSKKIFRDTVYNLAYGLASNITKLKSANSIISSTRWCENRVSNLKCMLYTYSVILTNVLIIATNHPKRNLKVSKLFFKGLINGADIDLKTKKVISFEECFLYSKVLLNYLISDLNNSEKIKSDLRNKFFVEPIY